MTSQNRNEVAGECPPGLDEHDVEPRPSRHVSSTRFPPPPSSADQTNRPVDEAPRLNDQLSISTEPIEKSLMKGPHEID